MTEYPRATCLVWTAAGSPAPRENNGDLIPPSREGALCAMCGTLARWSFADGFSDNFRPVRQQNNLFPFGGSALCAACVWSAKTLRLRCAAWIARPGGLWWLAKSSLLATLLDPPAPPFVVALPAYGIAHGGEVHGHRATLDGEMYDGPGGPLIRLQAKHVTIYTEIAYSRERYPFQVDDALSLTVDVPRWTAARDVATTVARTLREGGCGWTETRDALTTLQCPARVPLSTHARWHALTRPLAPEIRAAWWPTFVDLLPIPEGLPRPAKSASKSPKASKSSAQRSLL